MRIGRENSSSTFGAVEEKWGESMRIGREDYRNPSWIWRNGMQRKYENWKRAEGIIVIGRENYREALLELKEKNVREALKLEEDYRGLFWDEGA